MTDTDLVAGYKLIKQGALVNFDIVRGRCVRTDITVRPGGTATVETRCRGESATRWVTRLKGKKMLSLVQ